MLTTMFSKQIILMLVILNLTFDQINAHLVPSTYKQLIETNHRLQSSENSNEQETSTNSVQFISDVPIEKKSMHYFLMSKLQKNQPKIIPSQNTIPAYFLGVKQYDSRHTKRDLDMAQPQNAAAKRYNRNCFFSPMNCVLWRNEDSGDTAPLNLSIPKVQHQSFEIPDNTDTSRQVQYSATGPNSFDSQNDQMAWNWFG